MEGYEDDDDTHFCIKCNLTIHGLDNYVRHRQSGCRPPPDDKSETVHESPSTPTTVSYPEILNADAFFSSLQLQSSAKSNPRRVTTLIEAGQKDKKQEDRRKRGQKGHVDVDETVVKDKLHSMLPDLDDPTTDLCIQSLVFPDIVASTSGKATSHVASGKLTQSMPQTGPAIDGATFPTKHESETSLTEYLMTDSKQADRKRQENSQRIESDHQTWREDGPIINDFSLGNTESKEPTRYDFKYLQDDDSEDDTLDDDLGDDDSYSDSDDGDNRGRPPRGYTGGKWEPGLSDLPQGIPHMHEEDVDPEDEHQEHSPPAYSGGKWKPAETSQVRGGEESRE